MLRRLIIGAAVVAAGVLVYRAMPDLKRYMEIRKM
ncbi:DUF6893 family small protein [Planotetraspora kaengkrachanensis]